MGNNLSRPWTDDERAKLKQLRADGFGPTVIGRLLDRTKYSVGKQIQAMHLARHKPPEGVEMVKAPEIPRARPLAPGASTLPPLPSEVAAEMVRILWAITGGARDGK